MLSYSIIENFTFQDYVYVYQNTIAPLTARYAKPNRTTSYMPNSIF